MAPQFINKVCIITIGLAKAKTLLALGARVTMCDMNGANLDKLWLLLRWTVTKEQDSSADGRR
ncbi:hypothetical protein V1524DRAFT_443351, partial [Lipomyces starkeyi]